MWTDIITVAIGNRVVRIGVDDDDTAALVRVRLPAWIETGVSSAEVPGEPALGVRVSSEPSSAQQPSSIRAVPQLRLGARTIARSRQVEPLIDELDRVLGSMHAEYVPAEGTSHRWLRLRPLVSPTGDVVLLAAAPPILVGDRKVQTGWREMTTWGVALLDDGRVEIPPPLSSRRAGEPSTVEARTVEAHTVTAVLGLGDQDDSGAAALAQLATHHDSGTWFALLEGLARSGGVAIFQRPADLRRRLVGLAGPVDDVTRHGT